ncbi:hypothetical protein [Haloarchaeobius salinus]|uniref:hypothetical protein n=1 Tax=Haloarchaeobius salinus TaxID=1198298 RepID=UPI0021089E1B|nr:hypothetical protein [Haloarchaeobius salinus]
MGPDELETYVERAGSAVAASAELGLRNTQLRLVEPFLECLGWDVRSPAVEAAFDVEDADAVVDYALLVDDAPAVFVDTLACESSLGSAEGDALLSAMDAAGVQRGILTNGRRFAFVARGGNGEGGFTCSLTDLPPHADDLERFTPERASEYVAAREQRLAAAEAIAAGRDDLADSIVAELRSLADDDAAALPDAELERLTESFVDEVVGTIAPAETPTQPAAGSVRPPARGPVETDDRPEDGPTTTADGRETEGGHDTGTDANAHDADGATHAAMADDGEYVARLFKGRTSIGAVGGSSVAGTMKEAADYLLEQHHLDAGLSLPYVPDDGGHAVLNRVPRHPSGEPMDEYVQLDAGAYLRTDGTLAECRERVETLAREAGLRVMFQGDWDPR